MLMNKEGGNQNDEFKREKHRKSICERNLVGATVSYYHIDERRYRGPQKGVDEKVGDKIRGVPKYARRLENVDLAKHISIHTNR